MLLRFFFVVPRGAVLKGDQLWKMLVPILFIYIYFFSIGTNGRFREGCAKREREVMSLEMDIVQVKNFLLLQKLAWLDFIRFLSSTAIVNYRRSRWYCCWRFATSHPCSSLSLSLSYRSTPTFFTHCAFWSEESDCAKCTPRTSGQSS